MKKGLSEIENKKEETIRECDHNIKKEYLKTRELRGRDTIGS